MDDTGSSSEDLSGLLCSQGEPGYLGIGTSGVAPALYLWALGGTSFVSVRSFCARTLQGAFPGGLH